VIELDELQAVVGKPLPGGIYTIEHHRHSLMLDAVGGFAGPDGAADVMEAYFGAVAGMGVTLDELYGMVGASADDGPMFGEVDIELAHPLRVGVTYVVSATIASIVRKRGRRAGTFDVATVRFELETQGEVVAVVQSSFVFPRREA
jgi:hypothetical protein